MFGENINELSDYYILVLALVKNFVLGVILPSKVLRVAFFGYYLS
jgi:hypothetical protein